LDKLWSNTGADKMIILQVYFMNEHEKEEDILRWMSEWSEHCGVIFKETKYIGRSQIRVDFQEGEPIKVRYISRVEKSCKNEHHWCQTLGAVWFAHSKG
jgi:hypothetical protein